MKAFVGTNARVAAATLALLLFCLGFRDLIPKRRGIGYDGAAYAHWARVMSIERLHSLATGRERGAKALRVDPYRARRFLPSVLVYYGMGLTAMSRRPPKVVAAFTAANIGLVTLAVLLWCVAADAIGVGDRAKWLGFPALAVSYANLKMPLYYPVLTDSFALALGSACLALHLRRAPWAVAVLGIVGAGVWPSLPIFTALLVAFPYRGPQAAEPGPRYAPTSIAAAVGLAGFAYTVYLVETGYEIDSTDVTPIALLGVPSAAITGVCLFFGLRWLLDSGSLWRSVRPLQLLRSPWIYVAVGIVAFSEWLPREIANLPPIFEAERLVNEIFWSSANQPAAFWVAHMLYYGPLLAFLPFVWKPLCDGVKRHGTGLVACFGLAVVLGVGSESRKWINFLPFLVLFLVVALEKVVSSWRRQAVLFALALLFSKVWLPMDRALSLPLLGKVGWRQLYISSRGPWIDEWVYAIQLVPALLVVLLAWSWVRRTGTEST